MRPSSSVPGGVGRISGQTILWIQAFKGWRVMLDLLVGISFDALGFSLSS